MKSLFRLPNLLVLAVAMFAFSACTTDPPLNIPPTVNLLDEVGFLANDATLTAGSPILVKLDAMKGDSPMKTIQYQQDGVNIADIERISVDGATPASNTVLLFDGDLDAFTKEVSITPHATGVADYTFLITDDAGESSSVSITITIESEPPTISATDDIVEINATAGGLTTLSINASKSPSEAELTTLSVYEDGSLASGTNRFYFNDIAMVDGTVELADDDRNSLNNSKMLFRTNDTPGTVETFIVEVTDANGLTAELTVTVTANEPVVTTTPLEKEISGALLNSAGLAGTGGLDIDTGVGTGSSTTGSELKDEGIDLSMPDDQNWKQKISAINGATLKYIEPSTLPDAFSFAAVDNKEAVQGLYDANVTISVSERVQEGDIFAVSANGKFYLLEVATISVTSDDNLDQYLFNIKF